MSEPATFMPAAEWSTRKDLARLIGALGEGQARYVGGAVRDTLLGADVQDIDLATPLAPVEVIARLDAAKIRSVPTGIAHGTVTAILDSGNVEITTLRRDVATDGRRAEVVFASDWREDAARRDFTINALYADPQTHEVFDYFGGLRDLAARRIRFIGDAHERIREDHLRILRYFRFQARFGSDPADEKAEQACHELRATLAELSRERVGWELQNLLALRDPAPTVARMAELGVLGVILPEARAQPLADLVAAEAGQHIAPDPIRRLAALLPADPAQADAVAARLRLSNTQRKRLAAAAARGDALPTADANAARALAYKLGRDGALDRLLLMGSDTSAIADWDIPVFPLKGGDLVAAGVAEGPRVSRLLRKIESQWIAEGFPEEARVSALLEAELARS